MAKFEKPPGRMVLSFVDFSSKDTHELKTDDYWPTYKKAC